MSSGGAAKDDESSKKGDGGDEEAVPPSAADDDVGGGEEKRGGKKRGPRRLVLVTGGSRGIGRATAILLARNGCDVAVCYRSDEASARAVAEEASDAARRTASSGGESSSGGGDEEEEAEAKKEAPGGEVRVFQADVSSESDVRDLFGDVASSFGREPDGLVNSAGIVGPMDNDIAAMRKEDMDAVLAANLYGPFYCCREFVRRRRAAAAAAAASNDDGNNDDGDDGDHNDRAAKRRKKEPPPRAGGSIVNVSSGLMKVEGRPLFYAMSKCALDSVTIGLSKSLPVSDGIRINAVAPGTTMTDLVSKERAEEVGSKVPMGRVAVPEEVAEAIWFLLDEERSGYCCGATISVTGGR